MIKYDRWGGKLLSEMTKEELIKAIVTLGNILERDRESHSKQLNFVFELMKGK